ncbi:MAG TPA: hypothetical protein PLM00_01925 [Spirochaetota bacterium]|nr:hypothetical protein [Spirochaetota bacterium]HPN82117.1 hypothetical protein [Spirochaetota bacterium]
MMKFHCEFDNWSRGKKVFAVIGMVILGIAGVLGLALLFGIVIRELWNWLMPGIFGLGVIDYWQAVGLFILGRLLFGGFGHGGGHSSKADKKIEARIEKKLEETFCSSASDDRYEEYWESEGRAAYERWKGSRTTGQD